MAVFGPKLQFLKGRSATCESRSRPPPLSFLLNHRYHAPKFRLNLKHHDGSDFGPFRACCLLACCLLLACLLAAKPGRSTLDTKKGYKTKTGSTSSVTLTSTTTHAHSSNLDHRLHPLVQFGPPGPPCHMRGEGEGPPPHKSQATSNPL